MAPKQEKPAPKKTTSKTKAPAKKTSRSTARRAQSVSHDAIAERAYQLYQVQGGGDQVAHWLQAERELTAP